MTGGKVQPYEGRVDKRPVRPPTRAAALVQRGAKGKGHDGMAWVYCYDLRTASAV